MRIVAPLASLQHHHVTEQAVRLYLVCIGVQKKQISEKVYMWITFEMSRIHTSELALRQVAGTCRAPEGHRGPGKGDRGDTSM